MSSSGTITLFDWVNTPRVLNPAGGTLPILYFGGHPCSPINIAAFNFFVNIFVLVRYTYTFGLSRHLSLFSVNNTFYLDATKNAGDQLIISSQ